MGYIAIDIETYGDNDLAMKSGAFGNISAPSNYKDPVKIASYIEIKKQEFKEKLALKIHYAQVKLIKIFDSEKGMVTFENFGLDKKVEKDIIEKAITYIRTGSASTHTKEIVTFNGKKYDFPVLMARGEILHADIPYRWLQGLTGYGDRAGHYDMSDGREGSLDINLKRIFGKGKHEIDFLHVSDADLDAYAEDEMKGLVKWWCLINGFPVPEGV
jgi:predicted PolB exonuclease-like 3'-5' exonuclease